MKLFFFYSQRNDEEYREVILYLKQLPRLEAPENFEEILLNKTRDVEAIRKIKKIEIQEKRTYNLYNKFIPSVSIAASILLFVIYFAYFSNNAENLDSFENLEPINKSTLMRELEPVKHKLLITLDEISEKDVIISKKHNFNVSNRNQVSKITKSNKNYFSDNFQSSSTEVFSEHLKTVNLSSTIYDRRFNSERFVGFFICDTDLDEIRNLKIKIDSLKKLNSR